MNIYFVGVICQDIATFTVSPINTCFVLGGVEADVQFNCSINHVLPADTAVIWYSDNFGAQESLTSNTIVNDIEKYDVQGEYNLLVLNVATSDVKDYICTNLLSGSGSITASAELVMIGKLVAINKSYGNFLHSLLRVFIFRECFRLRMDF